MKKLFLTLVLTTGVMAISFGQDSEKFNRTPEQNADSLTAKMKKALNLNDDQVAKAKEINLKAVNSIQDEREKLKQAKQELKTAMEQAKTEADVAYKQILDAEQYAKYKKMAERMMDRKKDKMRGAGKRKMK